MRETLQFIASTNFDGADDRAIAIIAQFLVYRAKEALAQPQEARNFCPRCGKRTPDPAAIHTCTPPKREWVGLTDEHIGIILNDPNIAEVHQGAWLVLPYAYAYAIEAKLKEKNT